MLKPNEGAEQIEQWTAQQAGLERERAQITQQREGFERDLAQVSQQYQGIDGQYQRAQRERDGVKADQLVGRVSKHDLTDVLGRSRSRPGRGISRAPQFGGNRGHHNGPESGPGL